MFGPLRQRHRELLKKAPPLGGLICELSSARGEESARLEIRQCLKDPSEGLEAPPAASVSANNIFFIVLDFIITSTDTDCFSVLL